MKSEQLTSYISNHRSLFWYTPSEKLESISLTFLVETILNYGTMSDVKELFDIVGLKKVAGTFFKSTQNAKRHNYFPDVENYFTLYFNKYAH